MGSYNVSQAKKPTYKPKIQRSAVKPQIRSFKQTPDQALSQQRKKVKDLAVNYMKVEEDLFEELGELPNTGGECMCRVHETPTVSIVHGGHDDNKEIIDYCMACGGVKV